MPWICHWRRWGWRIPAVGAAVTIIVVRARVQGGTYGYLLQLQLSVVGIGDKGVLGRKVDGSHSAVGPHKVLFGVVLGRRLDVAYDIMVAAGSVIHDGAGYKQRDVEVIVVDILCIYLALVEI